MSLSFYQFIIGDGNNLYDFTYVENVAHAHICAERALASQGAVAEAAAGQVLCRLQENINTASSDISSSLTNSLDRYEFLAYLGSFCCMH